MLRTITSRISLRTEQLRFDYKLTPGTVQTTNALKLMRSIGLDV